MLRAMIGASGQGDCTLQLKLRNVVYVYISGYTPQNTLPEHVPQPESVSGAKHVNFFMSTGQAWCWVVPAEKGSPQSIKNELIWQANMHKYGSGWTWSDKEYYEQRPLEYTCTSRVCMATLVAHQSCIHRALTCPAADLLSRLSAGLLLAAFGSMLLQFFFSVRSKCAYQRYKIQQVTRCLM